MLVLIRTDASAAIGLGHLRRCLSLAGALRSLGADVRFGLARSDVDSVALAAAEGFVARTFNGTAVAGGLDDPAAQSAASSQCHDASAFMALWPGEVVEGVLVDHYRLNASWHAHVRQGLGCRVGVIDDLADRPLDADVLIDHNFVPPPGHRARYASRLQREPAAWLCGPRFALLGPAYAHLPPFETVSTVRSIGIFLGGTDPAGLSATALSACRQVAGFSGPVEVVSTSANPGLATLRQAVAQDSNAVLTLNLPDLAGFFGRHDLQIGAGGGASWERCAVGAPTLTLCVAENQRAVIPALEALGAVATTSPAGSSDVALLENSASAIGRALSALVAAPERRRALSHHSRALVDGLGAQRVALVLCLAMAAPAAAGLVLRAASLDDAPLLWAWRNHPTTRSVSRQTAAIAWADHLAWLTDSLANPRRKLWLGQVHNTPVGVIRFDDMVLAASGLAQSVQCECRHEVSLYLDPDLHGLGLGAALLAAGEAALVQQVGGAVTVFAEVLADNAASERLFLSAGYQPESELRFVKPLIASAVRPSPSESLP